MTFPRDARGFVPFVPSLFARIMQCNPELAAPPKWGLARLIATQWLADKFDEEGRLAHEGEEDMPCASITVDPPPWLIGLRGQVRFTIENMPVFEHQNDGPRLAYPPEEILRRYLTLRFAQKDQDAVAQMERVDASWQALDEGYFADMAAALEHLGWTSTPDSPPHTPSPLLHGSVHLRVPRAPLLQRHPSEDVIKLRCIQELRWRHALEGATRGRIVPIVVQPNRPTIEGLRRDDAWVAISLLALMTGLEALLKGFVPQVDRDWGRYLMDPVPLPAPGMVHDARPIVRYRDADDAHDPDKGYVCVLTSQVIERINGTCYAKPVALFIPGRMAWEMVVGALFAQERQGAMLLNNSPPPQCGYCMDRQIRLEVIADGRWQHRGKGTTTEAQEPEHEEQAGESDGDLEEDEGQAGPESADPEPPSTEAPPSEEPVPLNRETTAMPSE